MQDEVVAMLYVISHCMYIIKIKPQDTSQLSNQNVRSGDFCLCCNTTLEAPENAVTPRTIPGFHKAMILKC